MNPDIIRVAHILEATTCGTKKHVLDIAMRLDSSKYDVTLICSTLRDPQFHEDIEYLRRHNIKVQVIEMKRAIQPLADFYGFLKIYAYLRRHSFNILHAHSSKAGFLGRIAGKLARIKIIIYSPHCYFFQQKKGMIRLLFLSLEKLAARFTDMIVAVSKGEEQLSIQEHIAKSYNITTIENGIDLSHFDSQPDIPATKRKLGIDPQSPIIGTISRITYQKGYRYFFEAASIILTKHPNTYFLFQFCENDRIKAQKFIDRLEISDRVILLDNNEDIRELLAVIDIFVLSSLWEGLPYTLLEAMAMSKPVVATRIAGIEEVVRHKETGYLVDTKNADALAERILELINDQKRAKEMGEMGRKVVTEKYRVETQIQKLSDLYDDLSHSKRPIELNQE